MQHDFITTDHYYCYVCSRNYADTFSAICSLQFQTSNAAIHSIFRKSTAWCDFFHAGGLLPATCFLTAGQSWITGADRNSSDSWTCCLLQAVRFAICFLSSLSFKKNAHMKCPIYFRNNQGRRSTADFRPYFLFLLSFISVYHILHQKQARTTH